MVSSQEVVITGVGVVSPVGIGREAFWSSLLAGESGVAHIEGLAEAGLPVTFGAQLKDFDPKQYVKPRKSLKVMCREIQTGFSAAVLAMEDAALEKGSVDPERMGVVYGSEMLHCDPLDLAPPYQASFVEGRFRFGLWGDRGMHQLYPLWMLQHLPNMTACHVGIFFDARGPNNSHEMGEVSSLLAVMEAAAVIERGWADVMIAGGAGTRLNRTTLAYRGDWDLAQNGAEPAAVSRPFDADRRGMVNGEGAGALVLESRRHAEARGATILARVAGYASRAHARQRQEPLSGDAVARVIHASLEDARLTAADVDHVNAHGLSTKREDIREARGIQQTLGETPVFAPKSYFGYLGAGGAIVELAASVLSLTEGKAPVTLNYQRPDPDCPVNVISEAPPAVSKPAVLKVSQNRTGQTAAVALLRA